VNALRAVVAILCSSAAVLAGCASGPSSPTDTGGTTADSGVRLVFRAAPIDEAAIVAIIPLGNLNPPGHTLPTDHIYVNNRRAGESVPPPAPVYAPGDGTVRWILRLGAESKIGVGVGSYTYYLDHVELDPSIREGATLTAGQRVGQLSSLTYGVDLGVFNDNHTNFFANPARYPGESLHGEKPLQFYEEPLRSRLYARVQRLGSDLDGRFDLDVNGYLVGNWYLEGLPAAGSGGASAWSQHLAFVYDNYDPTSIRVAIGGTLGMIGAFAVNADALDPAGVSPSTGRVAYRLRLGGGPGIPGPPDQRGLLVAQMIGVDRIRVEVFAGSQASDAEFTSAARTYVR
jgi:hypothetical protein